MPLALVIFIVFACCAGGAAATAAVVHRNATRAGQAGVLEAPIAGIDDAAWTAYVVQQRGNRGLHTVTVDGRMGAFAFTARELADVGLMAEPHKGAGGVWLGTWAPGLALPAFLGDARMQYWALVELTKQHAAVISDNYAAACKELEIDGLPVTLSGLLAGARKAGLGGLRNWVEDSTDRLAHSATTKQIRMFSEIF